MVFRVSEARGCEESMSSGWDPIVAQLWNLSDVGAALEIDLFRV